MSKKQQVLTSLFEHSQSTGNYEFNNDLVKRFSSQHGFGNPFDVTKIDNLSIFPAILLENDYFLIHLGRGRHKFIPGISNGFHDFEAIDEREIKDWRYRQSILNELDSSESNILSLATNQFIINDFLYEDITANPKVYFPRRTKLSFDYFIGEDKITTDNLQMEIDLTMELDGHVTVIEGKNGFPENFAVYQLYHPFRYYIYAMRENGLQIDNLSCCYVTTLRTKNKTSNLRLYNYTFEDPDHMDSIRLLKKAQYNLVVR